MRILQRMNKERCGAALMILLGAAVTLQGSEYRFGSLRHMGAGFMPVVYGVLLAIVGVLLMLTAKREPDEAGHPPEWRGWLCILASVFAFALLGSHGGLIPATFVSVFVAALGDRQNSLRDAALLALLMVAAGVLIFRFGLHIQLPLFTWS